MAKSKAKTKSKPKAKASAPAKKASSGKKILKKQSGTAAYEKKLLEMREDLVNLVHQKQEQDLTAEPEVGDEADAASQSAERELLFELSDNERQTLDAIEAALRKIETGSYGVCEGCTKTIPAPRLKAIPMARYCIQCQARFEIPNR